MSEQIYQIAFYSFAGLAVLSALVILFTKNVMYAAAALLFSLLGVAAVFVLANASFLAVTQILVYVGGVLILILFGVMLSKRTQNNAKISSETSNPLYGVIVALGLFFTIGYVLHTTDYRTIEDSKAYKKVEKELASNHMVMNANHRFNNKGTLYHYTKAVEGNPVHEMGYSFMTTYLLPFELVAIILLVALIGAAHVAGYKNKEGEEV